ncbi:MAG: serine protease, partial [Proteobacteria bacterium]|nr:serine protease [Pseudomonadota bacterium]
PLKTGEPVIVTGYPSESMNGEFVEFLTGDAKVTYTKSHIGDDSQFMFTYAAKSGYSGGPVLDAAGNVVGMTASATCTSSKCMDGFKQTFSMKASTVEEVEKLEETIAKHVDTNIASSLPVIYRFLEKNGIPHEESAVMTPPTAERINEIAQSVANIRCPSEEKSLVEHSGVVRTTQ